MNIKKIIVPVIIAALLIVGTIIIFSISKNNGASYNPKIYYIDLLGEKKMTIYVGSEYIEPGYRATSSKGENLTSSVIVDNQVNSNAIGEYVVRYMLKDTTVIRKVNVTEKPVGATYIFLYGDVVMYMNAGEEYKEPGYEVVDSVDGGKLKNQVKVDSSLNTKKGGAYKITYSVINSSGITTTKQRTVIVMDSDVSLTLDNENYTNNDVTINFHVNDPHYAYVILPNGNKVTEYTYAYKVSENKTYMFSVYNQKGTKKEATITVSNINKTKPTGSCSGSYQNGTSTISVNAVDDIGIAKYVVNNNTFTNNQIKINGEYQSVSVTIYDKAGNSSTVNCSLKNNNGSSTPKPSATTPNNLTNGNMKNVSDKPPIWKNTAPNSGSIYVNHYTATSGQSFSFWSYVPKNATKNLPLVIYIPPVGSDDYYSGGLDTFADGPLLHLGYHYCDYNAIVIHLGHPNGYKTQQFAGAYMELIRKIVKEFDVNKNNISIMGFSNGCYGANDIINQNPNYFAAAVLIGCSPANPGNYVHTPLWCLSGSGDGISSYYGTPMPTFVNQVNSMGGHAWFTATGTGHNIFEGEDRNSPLIRYKVVDWMISSNKLDSSYKNIKSCK